MTCARLCFDLNINSVEAVFQKYYQPIENNRPFYSHLAHSASFLLLKACFFKVSNATF
jgi:hypothetical protein